MGILCGHTHVAHLEVTNIENRKIFTAIAPSIAAEDCVHRLGYSVLHLDIPLNDSVEEFVKVNQVSRYIDKWGLKYEDRAQKALKKGVKVRLSNKGGTL